MKKSIIKKTSIILTFVLLMSTIFGISSHAISTSCVEDHFTNLITTGTVSNEVIRTPPSAYSCSYTAISMLLSFYDSYWRDDFIVSADGINETDWEQGVYDPETDTLIETFSASREALAWKNFRNSDESNYNEFIIHPDNDHFLESYLISLAKEIELCGEEDTVFGLHGYEIVELLEYYLYDVRGFTEDQITVHIEREVDIGSSNEMLFEQMVNHIDAGFPLIYAGYDWDPNLSEIEFFNHIQEHTGGHAMIAYSFDGTLENPTDVNLHTGWSRLEHTETVNNTEYRNLNLIIWLEIGDLPHQCTDAYRNPENTQTFCACEIYSTHLAHENNHLFLSDGYDNENHFKVCHCGIIGNVNPHNLSYSYVSSSEKHLEFCTECSYSSFVDEHNYNIYSSSSAEGHGYACVCGEMNVSPHYPHSYTSKNKTSHYKYCECGYLIGEETHSIVQTGRYGHCIECGVVIDMFSDITIKGEEENPDLESE